jgi:hypothetical protein
VASGINPLNVAVKVKLTRPDPIVVVKLRVPSVTVNTPAGGLVKDTTAVAEYVFVAEEQAPGVTTGVIEQTGVAEHEIGAV